MKGKFVIKLIVGMVVILLALVYLVSTIQTSWAYDISVDVFQTDTSVQARKARVGGIVKVGSIDIDLEEVQLDFVLAGLETSMPVSYFGTVPENFEEDREVLVEGKLDKNGVFQASKVITKCESKYKAKVVEK